MTALRGRPRPVARSLPVTCVMLLSLAPLDLGRAQPVATEPAGDLFKQAERYARERTAQDGRLDEDMKAPDLFELIERQSAGDGSDPPDAPEAGSPDAFERARDRLDRKAADNARAALEAIPAFTVPAGELFWVESERELDDPRLEVGHGAERGPRTLYFEPQEATEIDGLWRYRFQAPAEPGDYAVGERRGDKAQVARLTATASETRLVVPREIDICETSIPIRYKGPRGKADQFLILRSPGTRYEHAVWRASLTDRSSASIKMPSARDGAGDYTVVYASQGFASTHVPLATATITITGERPCPGDEPILLFNPETGEAQVLSPAGQ